MSNEEPAAQSDIPEKRNAGAEPEQTEEEAKRQAMRKRKPLGSVVKPLTKEQIEALLRDPEVKERDNLLDALPKGWDEDYQDEF
jgi:uncharacterized protein YdiU (UPF0061 family)